MRMDRGRSARSAAGFEVPPPPSLSFVEGELLVQLALSSIRGLWAEEREAVPLPRGGPLHAPAGAFVTLHRRGSLRGCMGLVSSPDALWQTVAEIALASATRDPRFDPLAEEEFPDLTVEISVLGPLARFPERDPERLAAAIAVGDHGLVVRAGARSGLLLPQVASRSGWDSLRFLAETCTKAGLRLADWRRDGAEAFAFRCAVFRGPARPDAPAP
jgi:AmmeMemoRadiSam system protein A